MNKVNERSTFRLILWELEAPFLYALAVIASLVGLLVWGATKTGSRGGGLLKDWQPIFGAEYGIVFAGLLGLILLSNRRWKGLAVMAVAYVAMGLMELLPKSTVPGSWDEFFALGAMLASLLLAGCAYSNWFEH